MSAKYNFYLSAKHISGRSNFKSDAFSRISNFEFLLEAATFMPLSDFIVMKDKQFCVNLYGHVSEKCFAYLQELWDKNDVKYFRKFNNTDTGSLANTENMKHTYSSMCNSYLRFCLYFGLTTVPANSQTVTAYTVFLALSLNLTSFPSYLNDVRLLHIEYGFQNPLFNKFTLDLVKKAIQRMHGSPPKQKVPITPQILLDI